MKRPAFIQARNYTRTSGRTVDLIVIHDMEAPEAKDTAENVSRWFAGPTAPQASSHYNLDSDSIVQGVLEKDVAWAAPGANHNGIQFEHAGYARQTPGEWNDAYSQAMLRLSAELAAEICKRYGLPIAFRSASALLNGARGITTHAEVSKAFKRSTHTDPGKNFPMAAYLRLVKSFAAVPPPPVEQRWPIPVPKWFWAWATWRFAGKAGPRPKSAPRLIPLWAWRRLRALEQGRKKS